MEATNFKVLSQTREAGDVPLAAEDNTQIKAHSVVLVTNSTPEEGNNKERLKKKKYGENRRRKRKKEKRQSQRFLFLASIYWLQGASASFQDAFF